MNPTEDTAFVMEEEKPTGELPTAGEWDLPKFPVLPHLLVIGFILFGIFSAVVIPKTLSYLQITKAPAALETAPALVPAAVILPEKQIGVIPLRATAAYVWDIKEQKALYEKNAAEALPLASITKLMTALLAYELVADETPVTIPAAAAAQQSGGTLREGEVFSAKELADFALISSFNSAAYTLAVAVGELLGEADPAAQFITAMNIRATELGLTSLKFYNPTGLDISATKAGAYGNTEEVSKLVEYIFTHHPEILAPTISASTRLYNEQGEYHEVVNTNEIVNDIPNLLGSKTGYTDLAGGNLTVIFDAGYNRPIVVTVLGSTYEERFSDVKALIEAVQSLIATE